MPYVVGFESDWFMNDDPERPEPDDPDAVWADTTSLHEALRLYQASTGNRLEPSTGRVYMLHLPGATRPTVASVVVHRGEVSIRPGLKELVVMESDKIEIQPGCG